MFYEFPLNDFLRNGFGRDMRGLRITSFNVNSLRGVAALFLLVRRM